MLRTSPQFLRAARLFPYGIGSKLTPSPPPATPTTPPTHQVGVVHGLAQADEQVEDVLLGEEWGWGGVARMFVKAALKTADEVVGGEGVCKVLTLGTGYQRGVGNGE